MVPIELATVTALTVGKGANRRPTLPPGFFETMRMPLHRGRGIEPADVEREEPVAVVNQALVDMVSGDEEPIGQRIRLGNPALARGAPDWLPSSAWSRIRPRSAWQRCHRSRSCSPRSLRRGR